MEADWEFEVGPDAPVIDAAWAGLVDLRREPHRANALPEAALLPALAEALATLNSSASSVWTSKCAFWTQLEACDFDPDELDAPPGHAACATGCYIDLLPGDERPWRQPETAAIECKQLCTRLRAIPLRCCRTDLVIRRAFLQNTTADEPASFGITAYLTACGETQTQAAQQLSDALAAFADAFVSTQR